MPRRKKSRKIGQIGVPSAPKEARKPKEPSGKLKKRKGNAPGSRHSVSEEMVRAANKPNMDPRVGSKKPIPLIVAEQSTPAPKKIYFTPAQELEALENDSRLSSLLDKVERKIKLSAADQEFVDSSMARHKELCSMLGINAEDDDESVTDADSAAETDPFAQLDAIDMDEFKDE